MTIPRTDLQLENEIWKQDTTWGNQTNDNPFDPTNIPHQEEIKNILDSKLRSDIRDDVFYPSAFLENLYSVTDSCALLAFFDTYDAVSFFTSYLDSRVEMTIEALRNQLSPDEFEVRAIHVLSEVQHSLEVFKQFCEKENVYISQINGNELILHIKKNLCHHELDLLEGTEKNEKKLFELLVKNKDIDSYPAIRKILCRELSLGKDLDGYIPILNFLENYSQFLGSELFTPLLAIWKKKIIKDINRVQLTSRQKKQYIAQKIADDLLYIFDIVGPEKLGLPISWATKFKKDLVESGRAKKLGISI